MADLPSRTRIVPIMASGSPVSRHNGRKSRHGRVRDQTLDNQVLQIQCLEELRLYASPITGDGNCLFYSLSDQLYGSTDRHEEIRARLVDHIRTNPDYFMQFVTDVGGERRTPRRAAAAQAKRSSHVGRIATKDGQRAKFEEMLSDMGKTGFWGGSVEIQAFCQAYEKIVFVYADGAIHRFTSHLATSSPATEAVHLAYHSFEHYSSVRRNDGPHTGLPGLTEFEPELRQASDGAKAPSIPDSTTPAPSLVVGSLTLPEPWKISTIAEALPGFSRDAIVAMLTQCRGDINNAFARLLDEDVPSSESSANSSIPATQPSINGRMAPRAGLGSSSRSSSRHSSASKRSADLSDDDDEGGSIRPPIRRRRGRDCKRRILQDITLGISVRGEAESDVVSIRLRVSPDAIAEQAADATGPSACERGVPVTNNTESHAGDEELASSTKEEDKGDESEDTLSSSCHEEASATASNASDSDFEDNFDGS